MKKRWIVAMLSALTLTFAVGCTGNQSNTNQSSAPLMIPSSEENGESQQVDINNLQNPGETGRPEIPVIECEEPVLLRNLDLDQFITMGEYKGLEINVNVYDVDDADVESMALQYYQSAVTEDNGLITDEPVKMGDMVIFDYEGRLDGELFQGGADQYVQLEIGSGNFIPGFEEQMIGIMPGTTTDITVTFPEDYYPEVAGKEAVFTITVHYMVPTEMKDEVVAGFGEEDFKTVDELRQYVRDYLELSYEIEKEDNIQSYLLSQLVANCQLKAQPSGLIEQYENNIRHGLEENAAMMGLDIESFCYYNYGYSSYEFLEQYGLMALEQNLIAQYIVNQEGLNISDEELEEELLMYATQSGYGSVEEFLGDEDRESYREYFTFQKAMDFVTENAIIHEIKAN